MSLASSWVSSYPSLLPYNGALSVYKLRCRMIKKDNLRTAWMKRVYFSLQLMWL